jgi:CRP-like cAMP-binding protein
LNDHEAVARLVRRWGRAVNFSNEDRAAIHSLPFTRRTFARSAYLVREGEPTANCTLIVRGFLFRQKLLPDGARQIVAIHIPGEFADLQNGLLQIADHNLQSLTASEVLIVPKASLEELMEKSPATARATLIDTLIDSSIFREWVVNVGRRDARARIAHLLCEMMARLRASDAADGEMCDFPLTQEQIADATGLTAVHTNRVLQGLRRDGLIRLESGRLTILDWDNISEVADFNERYLHHEAWGRRERVHA